MRMHAPILLRSPLDGTHRVPVENRIQQRYGTLSGVTLVLEASPQRYFRQNNPKHLFLTRSRANHSKGGAANPPPILLRLNSDDGTAAARHKQQAEHLKAARASSVAAVTLGSRSFALCRASVCRSAAWANSLASPVIAAACAETAEALRFACAVNSWAFSTYELSVPVRARGGGYVEVENNLMSPVSGRHTKK